MEVIEVIVVVVLFRRRDLALVEHVAHALVEVLEVAARSLDDGEQFFAIGPPEALEMEMLALRRYLV